MNTKHVNKILTDYLIAPNETEHLNAIYSVYGRVISKFMALTKSGGNCYVKILV